MPKPKSHRAVTGHLGEIVSTLPEICFEPQRMAHGTGSTGESLSPRVSGFGGSEARDFCGASCVFRIDVVAVKEGVYALTHEPWKWSAAPVCGRRSLPSTRDESESGLSSLQTGPEPPKPGIGILELGPLKPFFRLPRPCGFVRPMAHPFRTVRAGAAPGPCRPHGARSGSVWRVDGTQGVGRAARLKRKTRVGALKPGQKKRVDQASLGIQVPYRTSEGTTGHSKPT